MKKQTNCDQQITLTCVSLFLMIWKVVKKWLQQRCFHMIFAKFWRTPTWEQLLLNQLGIKRISSFLLVESRLEEKNEYKIEDNPWMFWQVLCFCKPWYFKINYKYERCKHTKTKSCYKNISCWFICSFIFFNFSSLWWFKIWFNVFHPTNFMN